MITHGKMTVNDYLHSSDSFKTKGEANDYIDRWSATAHEAFDFHGHGDNYGDRL